MAKLRTLRAVAVAGAVLLAAAGAFGAAGADYPSVQSGTDIRPVTVQAGEAPPRLVVGDEIDRLEKALKPPKRFADYEPRFRVQTRRFTFHHVSGPKEVRYPVVMDGERFVALVNWGDVHLAAFDPGQARTRVELPTGRYHMDTFVGPKIDLNALIESTRKLPAEEQAKRAFRDEWVGSPRCLTLIRRQSTPTREVTNRFTLTVDPVFGYRIDGRYEAIFNDDPGEKKVRMLGHSYTPGIYIPWQWAELYDYTVYPHDGDGADKYRGWASNLYCIDVCDAPKTRTMLADPGFFAYLSRDATRWSPCLTRKDGTGPGRVGQCNAGHGPGFSAALPKLKLDADGKYRYRAVRRLFGLPPEVRDHIRQRLTLQNDGVKRVFLRIGRLETFEDQPIDLATPTRGLIWTGGGPSIVEGIAYSGQKSLKVPAGRCWPNLPQVVLIPQTRYRLEGYLKVVAPTAADIEKTKADDQRRRQHLAKQGRPLPPPIDWDKVKCRAYIRGDLFEWSPHSGKMLVKQTTNDATADTDAWQHVVLEFTTPKWDPFINISLNAEHCTAYLDNFCLKPIPADR